MSRTQFDVVLKIPGEESVPLRLAKDANGRIGWTASTLKFLPPPAPTRAQYGSLLPDVGDLFTQADLSGGIGVKYEPEPSSPDFRRYYYAEWWDQSVQGQGQKGPQVNTLSAPANSGPMNGSFQLGGNMYLLLGRKIVRWNSGDDTLVEEEDLGADHRAYTGTTFFVLGTETNASESIPTGATDTISDSADRVAQSVILVVDGTTQFLGRMDLTLTKSGTPSGDVRLTVQLDKQGRPDGVPIASATVPCDGVPTSPTVTTFRFDNDEYILLVGGHRYWFVLDVAGASAGNTIAVTRGSAGSGAAGTSSVSGDGGNSWTNQASGYDLTYTLYNRLNTTTAFVTDRPSANSISGSQYLTTSDGSTYTRDSARYLSHVAVCAGLLVGVPDSAAHAANLLGYLITSADGANWSESILVGDPTVPITNIIPVNDALIVTKLDSIWAVDLIADPPEVVPLQSGGSVDRSTAPTNGIGACEWRGVAYIPWDGHLVAVEGSFGDGFTVHKSIGPESLPQWDAPWGSGRVVAVRGDRFHLYAVVSATGGYRLLKTAKPLEAEWHGSLATLGDGSQEIRCLEIFDQGGSTSPELFFTTTGNAVGRIRLPRFANPAADSAYRYDIANTGRLYHPYSTGGGFALHPKAWTQEAITFLEAVGGDYADALYDVLDGNGYQRLPGPLYDTGLLAYPTGLKSRLLARQLQVTNAAATASPLILTAGVGYMVMPLGDWRELSFLVEAADGLEGLNVNGESLRRMVDTLPVLGTIELEDYEGNVYRNVRVLEARDAAITLGSADQGGRSTISVRAVGEYVGHIER